MNIQLMIQELKHDEGVRFFVYEDSLGIPTIGVGHSLHACPLPQGWSPPLEMWQVDDLLATDVGNTMRALDISIPWWVDLDEVRQRVLVNMCFNMGISSLLTFKNTLHAVQIGDYKDAAADMASSKWARQVGRRASRLIEAMSTGIMPCES